MYSNVLNQISHKTQRTHAYWCNKAVIVWLCVCMGDNPLAKARGLSSRTYTKPYNNLYLSCSKAQESLRNCAD